MESKTRDVSSDVRLKIDKDGRWYYGEQEITHPGVLKAFQSALSCDEHENHTVAIDNEVCTVEVCDAPLIAVSLRGDSHNGFLLLLNSGETVDLNPRNLAIGPNGVLYTRTEMNILIKFGRQTQAQLAPDIFERGDSFALKSAGQTYIISHLASSIAPMEPTSNPQS